jgi:hypothetical protein
MPDSYDRTEKSDAANAQEKVRAALERSVAEIKTPDQARDTLNSLEKTAGAKMKSHAPEMKPGRSRRLRKRPK